MAPGGLSEGLRSFIDRHLESVAQLEVLLLVRAAPEKLWSVEEIARAQVSAPDAVELSLRHLCARGLVGEQGGAFRYEPGGEGPMIDQLAEAYANRRPKVVAQVFAPPGGGAASTLAEGFRFRRRR